MKKAVYAGTFDPVTNFDMHILERSTAAFDEVTVLLLKGENAFFLPGERMEFLTESISQLKNVKVDYWDGLAVQYCREKKIGNLIRGVHSLVDMDREVQQSHRDKKIWPEVETFFLAADTKYDIVTSSFVRELASFNKNYVEYVPDAVFEKIYYGFQDRAVDLKLLYDYL